LNLTGTHFGAGTNGDITGGLLRAILVNDNGTLRYCAGYLGGRETVVTTDTTATATSATTPESLFCNTVVGSATNMAVEIGYVRADFDDTGGAAEDLWTIQTGVDDVVNGKTADGLWQPWQPAESGFSVAPSGGATRWTQWGLTVEVTYNRTTAGTSNATTYTFSMPVKANSAWVQVGGWVTDNGTEATTSLRFDASADSRTLTLYDDPSGSAWTGSGNKNARMHFFYEAGQ